MWQERIQRYLLPGDIESDPGFLAEIRRLSRMGLHVIGGIEIGVTVFMVATNLLLDANTQLVAPRLTMAALMVVVGTLTILSARVPPLYPWCRLSACLSCLASTAVLTWFFIGMTPVERSLKNFVPGNMTLVLLVAVAAVPLRPMQTLLLGSIMEVIYMTIASIQRQFFDAGAGIDPIFVVFTFMLTLLSTALSAVVYHQRSASWEIHNDMLQASDTLRQSETRNLLAQNAASVGRLAAALSHELNSPIGALISGVDTLLLLAARQAVCAGPEQQRMLLLQNELRKTIHQSTDRLKEIVARMQRFTNLDKAEVQAANLNEILSDVIALIEPNYVGRIKVVLDFKPVPELICRPQQLSAVFSNLLGNAIEATNGDGNVRIATSHQKELVHVDIEDNGRGLDPELLKDIFDPGFRISQGRVRTGNWSMFSSLQIIREHGGDITLDSQLGGGTRVKVTLPLDSQILT